jgi:CRISPR/Cas system-associated exonuclease Cas4 (RecB family)
MLRKIILSALAIIIIAFLVFFFSREARSDRAWDDEVQFTPSSVTEDDGTVRIKNVRDFTYGDKTILKTEWISEAVIDPDDIVRMWFLLEPFGEWKAVGHTLLTFELKDGTAYSFSVEARREKGEKYEALLGLVRQYELSYTWGTERDFVTRRLLYLDHPVRLYPLEVEPERVKKLFAKLLEKTNEVSENARFYNTITANCTNVLAELANDSTPGTIPYDISWNLPGYSDTFLMKIGFIKTVDTIEETQKKYDLTPKREEVMGIATTPHAEFGKSLRGLIQ